MFRMKTLVGCCALLVCCAALTWLAVDASAQAPPQSVQRLTADDAPVTLDTPQEPPRPPRTYLTTEQWIEVQNLMEETASAENGEPISFQRACEILGFPVTLQPHEMLSIAPSIDRPWDPESGLRTVPCPPNSLFSQSAYEPADPWTAGTTDQGADLQRFDSYSVPADICDVHWWGINATFVSGTGFFTCDRTAGGTLPDRYNIIFYPDLGGQPDIANPACSYLNVAVDGVTLIKTGTGLFYTTATDTFELFRYDLDLTGLGCCNLLNGWISIQGVDDGSNCWLLWMGSPDGDLSNCLLDTAVGPPLECGPPNHDYDLAVCLTGMVAPGACCNQDTGVCTDTPPVDFFTCMAMGPNMRFVPGGLCTDLSPPCGVAFGACCFLDGSCQELTNLDCAAAGGFFSGDGTNCTPNLCPQPCTCVAPITTFPHYENFEASAACSTTCAAACVLTSDWTNVADGTDDIDWAVDAGGTPSADTGPAMDFDPGTTTGKYVYTESSTPCESTTAILLSPCYDISGLAQPEFVFAYHMTGDNTGAIEVQVSTNDCITWTTEFSVVGQQQLNPTDPWLIGSVPLTAYAGTTNLRIRIVGLVGPGFESDMAIDGLRVFDSSATTGACCEADGSCTDGVTQSDCVAGGGTWQGSFSTCDTSVCGGACCLPDGTCVQASPADCASMGGGHQGAFACSDVSCPQPCACISPVNTFPYNEDWEAEPTCPTTCGTPCVLVGGWSNVTDGTDNFDWTIDEGGTPSTTTGPSQDANPGTPTGNYAYTEGSGTTCNNAQAILLSPCLDVSSLTSPLMIFGYHMYGANIVSLNVDVSTDNCLSWTNELSIVGQQQFATTDPWLYTAVDLSAYAGSTNLRVRFRGVTGTSFNCDMAVDDISIVEGSVLTGACCVGATCTENVTEADCIAQGGLYQGDFSNCGPPNPCVGACCFADGSCQELTEGDCNAQGGTYSGGGTTCAETICNDLCENATKILSVPYSTVVDTRLASPDGGPPGTCNTASATQMDKDVWYQYTPTDDCLLFLDVNPDFGVSADGIMQIYTGPDCMTLTPLGGLPGEDDPGCFDLNEPWSTQFNAIAGETYWFQIGDWGTVSATGGGPVLFEMTCRVGNFGACCLPDGSCVEVDDAMACAAAGGVYQGDLIPCSQASCPQPCPCTAPISTFPYNENWEGEATCSTTCGAACPLVGGWTNIADGTDDFDWTIDEGGTPSTDTGPSQDANPGTPTGNYAYTEGSGTTCNNSTAILLSPCFDISSLSDPLVLFAYHMTGDDMGDLHVEVSTDDCLNWTTELSIFGQQQLNETDPWIYDVVDLSAYAGSTNLRIRFRSASGPGFETDMAIDDISVFNGPITGACCEADGTCTDNVEESDCIAGGGRWQGPLSQCANIPTCGGACCTSTGCTILFEEECDAIGGIYQGDDVPCSSNDCNMNGVPDECDIATGNSTDCNENDIPDDCEGLSDCNGDGTPDICDPDCNMNGISDICDILNGTSQDCQPDGIPDECQIGGPGGLASVVLTEMDLGATDALEIQNVSGGVLDTSGWMVAISDTPYSDINTVNPIIQMLPASMAANQIIYWTDGATNPWGNNMFWNPGAHPTFSGWAIILDDSGNIVDFAIWNGCPDAVIDGLSLNIGPHTITIGDEWLGDGIVTDTLCGSGFSVQRQGNSDNNDAADWLCQATNLGVQNPGLTPPLSGGGGGADCNMNGIPDDCDIRDCPPGDISCGDCNNNGLPDGCELSGNDCNNNGVDDDCDVADGTSEDCNGNGIPDECDIASGTSEDCNSNGIPDECDVASGEVELYAQAVIPDDTGVGPGLLLAIGSSCPFNNTSAEDFTLAGDETITRLTWEGVYFGSASNFPGMDANFHVTFYVDNGAGNVGAVVADFPSVTVVKALSSRPAVFGTNPVYTYSTVLPAPVNVMGGQRYWLSINGDPAGAGGPVFGWMASNEGNATMIPGNDQPLQNTAITCATLPALTYTPGGTAGDQDADLAFALVGEAAGTSEDCNSNGIPDECEEDCNGNGRPDDCDIADDPGLDQDGNGVIDECECAAGGCPPGSTPLVDANGDFAGWCVSSSDPDDTAIFVDNVVPGSHALIEISKDFRNGPITLTFQQVCALDPYTVSMILIADESVTNLTGVAWTDFMWELVGTGVWFDVPASAQFTVWPPFATKTFGDFIDGPANLEALSLLASDGTLPPFASFFPGDGTGALKIAVDLSSSAPPLVFDLVESSSVIQPILMGDFDGDDDVDLTDFAVLSQCFGGSARSVPPACIGCDLDGDTDVDLSDFAIFSQAYTGSR